MRRGRRAPEAEAFKLALFALVRLGAYDPLAGGGARRRPSRVAWWPVAYALQRINDPRAAPALQSLLQRPGQLHARLRGRGSARYAIRAR